MNNNSRFTINKSIGYPDTPIGIILCFSGGRDSSCSALKLITSQRNPLLLTVIDSKLQNDEKTEKRVKEFCEKGQPFSWISVTAQDFYNHILNIHLVTSPSCFGCFMVKLSLAIIIAKKCSINTVAAGFTSYQGSWIEQSPTAIELIKDFLLRYDLELELPVWDFKSKQEASELLIRYGVSSESLEPLCHCAECKTNENAAPADIHSDFSLLSTPCHDFIRLCMRDKK
ncbi:MAG: hypothetical protein A2Y10_08765 [Planctomycetes bacterium GWF2_41_51]|nr:MAG: hypothetical protein A2Y10_08765 [Planctomycetes bacterium GWF2_41_51]HBG28353.1 hypothetical protein [Phycisphaerales bacterium]